MEAFINMIITAPAIMQWQQGAHQGPHISNDLLLNLFIRLLLLKGIRVPGGPQNKMKALQCKSGNNFFISSRDDFLIRNTTLDNIITKHSCNSITFSLRGWEHMTKPVPAQFTLETPPVYICNDKWLGIPFK